MSNSILFYLYCIFAGAAVSCGYVAFITLLGVFDKVTERYKGYKYANLIDWLVITGVTLGNVFYILNIKLNIPVVFYALLALSGGVFTGCIAGALTETLNVFPIISRRIKLKKGLPYIIIGSAIGKTIGSIIQLLN